MKPQRTGQTVAPLLSLIIRSVYAETEANFESDKSNGSPNIGLSKRLCCYLAFDLISGVQSNKICKVLHLSNATFIKYYSEIREAVRFDTFTFHRVNKIRNAILTEAILHSKYSGFLTREVKRENKLTINQ